MKTQVTKNPRSIEAVCNTKEGAFKEMLDAKRAAIGKAEQTIQTRIKEAQKSKLAWAA